MIDVSTDWHIFFVKSKLLIRSSFFMTYSIFKFNSINRPATPESSDYSFKVIVYSYNPDVLSVISRRFVVLFSQQTFSKIFFFFLN